jgi:integrase
MRVKLTDQLVATTTLPESKDEHFLWDSVVLGFGVRIRRAKSGDVNKDYVCRHKIGSVQRRPQLGPAAVLSTNQARGLAKEMLAKVLMGQDPHAAKVERRAADQHTFLVLSRDYLAAKQGKLSPRFHVEATRYLTDPRYFGPLHAMPVDKIALRDVAARLAVIERECGTVTPLRAKSSGRAMYAWGIAQGRAQFNPFNGAGDYHEPKPRDRVLSDGELAAIWKACGDDDFGKIVKLLILLAARRNEIGGMKWGELSYGTWKLPAERSKNREAHTLPLPPLAQSIVESIRRRNDRDLLFGHGSAAGFIQWDYAKRSLERTLGEFKPWTLHDLRRTAATRMCDLGVLPHVVEEILNHKSGHRSGVAGIYNRSRYENEVRAALELWAAHVSALVA